MSFDSKYYQIAENQLNDRKSANQRLEEHNKREIEKNCPEIIEIQKALRGTMSSLIGLIGSNDPDFSRKTEELRDENLRLQGNLREALVRRGYPADFLDPIYTCKRCNDRGYVDGKRCDCFMTLVKKAAAAELNRSFPMTLSGFEDFNLKYYDDKQITPFGVTVRDIMAENLEFCKKYAENFHLPCSGILMRGATGLGKTHLSLSIAKVVIEKGYSVVYGSALDFFGKAEKEHFGGKERETIDILLNADLLILDDIGAEFESKFYNSLFYNILNNRMNAAKPTIISTNCELNELLQRYGDRIVSRLKTMDDLIFLGTDVRILRASEHNS